MGTLQDKIDRSGGALAMLRGSQIEDAPPAPSRFTWDGFYFGGGAGVSDTQFKPGNGLQDLARFAYRNTLLGSEYDMGNLLGNLPQKRDSGATYFGFAGYNWTFGDAMLGFEADYTRSGQDYLLSDYIARRAVTSNGTVNDFSMTTNQGAKLNATQGAMVVMDGSGAVLAMVGLFTLFAFAAGIVRFADRSAEDPIARPIAAKRPPTSPAAAARCSMAASPSMPAQTAPKRNWQTRIYCCLPMRKSTPSRCW